MNYQKILFPILFVLLFWNCAPNLNYIGNSYKPTKNVSLYFDVDDVVKEYNVIGLLSFEFVPTIFNKENDYSILVLNKAKQVGADAVLITNFSNVSKDEMEEDILTKRVQIESNSYAQVEAKFLKYKK